MSISPKELAVKIAGLLDLKKAHELSVIEVTAVTQLADYFVICTGNSSTQVKALADEVEFKLKQEGITPNHVEGHRSRSWIVLDYGCVLCHVFDDEARKYYDLERLWADGNKLDSSEYIVVPEGFVQQ
ncbi:MAG: ribosome silencing factor [Ruminococcaceae bacterium]|nr:ribosome silencing factor [Oscillospiraceae bacterium]